MSISRKRVVKRIALGILLTFLFGCLILFVLLPLLFKCSLTLQSAIVFWTFVSDSTEIKLTAPEQQGLFATRNFHLTFDEPDVDDVNGTQPNTIRLGLWHVLPYYVAKRYAGPLQLTEHDTRIVTESQTPEHHLADDRQPLDAAFRDGINATNRAQFFERTLQEASAEIVLYLHGNANSRGAAHRIEMYQLLRSLGYHVIAFDYRGYGDSTGAAPTERGVVRDAIAVYEYIRQRTHNPVYVWGHSLGTGIATHMMSLLQRRNVPAPSAVVLEAPFNNMDAAIRWHPMFRMFRILPWFDYMIARPLYDNGLRFESDVHIAEFRQPVMMLHAEDDWDVAIEHCDKLYRSALDKRGKSWGPVEYHRFSAEQQLGHMHLIRSIELPSMIVAFFSKYRNATF